MKNIRKFGAFFILACVLLTFAGCFDEPPPAKEPKEIIKEAFTNLADAKTSVYDAAMTIKAMPSVPSEESKKIDFALDMKGVGDGSNPDAVLFSLDLNFNGSVDNGKKEFIDLEFMSKKADAYFIVNKISEFEGIFPKESMKDFVKKWWKMTIPEEILNQYKNNAQQNEMLDMFKKSDVFGNFEYMGSDWGDYHYKGALNKDELYNLIVKIRETTGQAASEEELKSLKASMDFIDATADLWINKDKMIITKIEGELSMTLPGQGIMNFELTLKIDDINEPVKITFPEKSTEINFMDLFGPLLQSMGGANPAGAAGTAGPSGSATDGVSDGVTK